MTNTAVSVESKTILRSGSLDVYNEGAIDQWKAECLQQIADLDRNELQNLRASLFGLNHCSGKFLLVLQDLEREVREKLEDPTWRLPLISVFTEVKEAIKGSKTFKDQFLIV